MTTVRAISGCGGKGPACFLVESAGRRLMLDLGYGPQPGRWPELGAVGKVDALLLSHGHADHAGGLSLLAQVGSPPVYATEAVARLLPSGVAVHRLPLQGSAEVLGVRVRTGRSGHAPGGVWLHLELGEGLLYMGDYSTESSVYAFDPPRRAATLILDASYGDYSGTLADCQKRIEPLFESDALLPVPEGGRGPDIALYLARTGRPLPCLDEAMRSALQRLSGPGRDSLRPGVAAELERLAASAPPIDGPRGVILASRADGTGGEAARLIEQWEKLREPAIVFTGYLPPGTPAERLTRSGRARYLRWNVHARLSDNAALVREVGARAVLPAFGEAKHLPVWQQAFAPARVATSDTVAL
jgi:Cft2 family RNA processing exonuclease